MSDNTNPTDDRAAQSDDLRQRVAHLEQVVEQQNETIRDQLPSRRAVLGGAAGALGLGVLGSGSASADLGGGPASDAMSDHRVPFYRVPESELDAPGVVGRRVEITSGGSEYQTGDQLVDTGSAWTLVDAGYGSVKAEQLVPMKFGILPDIHWGRTEFHSDAEQKASLDTFIDKMNEWGADFVFQTGDLVDKDTGGDFQGTVDAINDARDYIENTGGSSGNGLNCPVEYTLGNHEYKQTEYGDMSEIYDAMFGGTSLSDTFSTHEVNGWKLIQLNSAYTTDSTNVATANNRVPDSSDPFDGVSWIEQELNNTDKPVIALTHYGLNNSWGDNYRTAGNAYKTLKKFAAYDNFSNHIHGHAHANKDWDVGKYSVGPFGMNYYNAGHLGMGKSRWYTYGQPPTDAMFAYGKFYHPRRYAIHNTLNEIDRPDHYTDGADGSADWHPGSRLRGDGRKLAIDMGDRFPRNVLTTDTGDWNRDAQGGILELSTGTTAGSSSYIEYVETTTGVAWGTLEGFKIKVDLNTIGASNDYTARVGRGQMPRDSQADSGGSFYGFKIDGGSLHGIVGSSGTETQTSQLDTLSQGDGLHLSTMLFSPHICRFYWRVGGADRWQRAEITADGTMPIDYDDAQRIGAASVEDNAAENYQIDYQDYEFWKQGY